MQQDRLEGWMVRQIENADLAKETVIQLPARKGSVTAASLSASAARPSAATPRRMKGGVAASRRSVPAVAGREMCSLLPIQTERPAANNREEPAETFRRRDPDESVEKMWRAQFHDRRQPCVEDGHVDRTKVLHNMRKRQQHADDEQSPLFLWGLPREQILEFIRQSVLPASWANPVARPVGDWEAVPDEEDEAARVRRVISNALALAPPKTSKKASSPRAPSPPKSPYRPNDNASSPRRGGEMSPRVQSTMITSLGKIAPTSPRSPRQTPRSEEKIQHFIAELRADPTLWAAFQRDVEQIQHQYRLRNYTSDKIQENKERARTPRSTEAHEQRKKQAEERMERTRRQRERLVQVEDERLAAKREAYLRRVNPTRQLSTAEQELTVRYRRRKIWLHVVTFAAISNRWHQQLVQTKHLIRMAKVNGKAASTIQRIWRKWKWRHASKHTVVVYTWLRKCLWKLLLKVRCRRKARHATLIRQFLLNHLTESHAMRNFNRVMVQWRSKVIRAQKAGMSYIHCNRARTQALSIWWDSVDHERQRMDRQQNSNIDDGRRLTQRRDSIHGSIGSGAPGSAGAHRKSFSRTGSIALLGGMDEKLASMQMLLTPIELQRLQQTSVQVVKIPKSIKMQLLTQFLTEARRDFRRRQQAYREMVLCASYAREVKLEEARAIVQSSVKWDGSADSNRRMTRTGSISRTTHPVPCFQLFSNPNSAKTMEAFVRRGLQLTLDADPELRALVMRQQEHRLQSPHQSPRRPSVSFSGASVLSFGGPSASPALSPPPRNSILKKPTLGNLLSPSILLPPSVLATSSERPSTTPNPSGRTPPGSARS